MGSETLSVPEEKLWEVICVIRAGLDAKLPGTSSETRRRLHQWCEDEEMYLIRTGQVITMTVKLDRKQPKKPKRAEVARIFNEQFLPKRRLENPKAREVIGEELDMRHTWECAASPTKFCVFALENLSYTGYCIFCEAPRKVTVVVGTK